MRFIPPLWQSLRTQRGITPTKQQGLESRFITAVAACIEKFRAHPERFPHLTRDIRRCLVRVFPYAVLYTVEPGFILILAVMHCHRKPDYWRNRIAP